jgi:hypothetical protein
VFPEGGLAHVAYACGKSGEQSASRSIFLWEEVRVLRGWGLKTRSRERRFQNVQVGRNGITKVRRDRLRRTSVNRDVKGSVDSLLFLLTLLSVLSDLVRFTAIDQ